MKGRWKTKEEYGLRASNRKEWEWWNKSRNEGRERENKTTWGDQQQAKESEEMHHLEGQTLVGVKRNWRNEDEAAKRQRGRFRGETGKSPRLKGEVAVLPVWVGLVCPLVPQCFNLCAVLQNAGGVSAQEKQQTLQSVVCFLLYWARLCSFGALRIFYMMPKQSHCNTARE